MKKRADYVRRLEDTIKKFLEPISGIPFSVAIKALTDCEVLPFDKRVSKNREFLKVLTSAVRSAGNKALKEGINTARPNEAGNRIEPFVINALRKKGIEADKPKTRSGKRRAAGYPDIEIRTSSGIPAYIDCKTYNIASKGTSFRTFYLSPSADPKITKDGFHLLVSFELTKVVKHGESVFVPVAWGIYKLDSLLVQVKHEFNASNADLYKEDALLASGKLR